MRNLKLTSVRLELIELTNKWGLVGPTQLCDTLLGGWTGGRVDVVNGRVAGFCKTITNSGTELATR